MADLIDRQAALDAIKAWCADYPLELQEPIDDCWNSVRELPAVQPDHIADVGKKVEAEDCISRQMAIDALIEWYGCEPSDIGAFENIIEKLPSVQPENKWTPCRKKLPEKEGFYLVQALMNGDIFVARWEGCYWGVKTPIVAWRPLPDPYRGGEE